MIDFLILVRDWGKETGVTVSTKHLSNLMQRLGISHKVFYYKNDDELFYAVNEYDAHAVILQAPTFGNDTLGKILKTGKETALVIHSTISYLQVEEGAFQRVQDYLSLRYPNWSICNPSKYEVKGFSSYSTAKVFYLPNTFNPNLDKAGNQTSQQIAQRAKINPKRVSLFCEYRPFKNLTTQVTALAIASKKVELELHMLKPNNPNNIYDYVKCLTEKASLKTVWHNFCSNEELHNKIREMSVGMQVSYSETFSYILFEHMAYGIPTIGSTTVPYSSLVPDFNDAVKIADSICELTTDDKKYMEYAQNAINTAHRIKEENDRDALATLNALLGRSQ